MSHEAALTFAQDLAVQAGTLIREDFRIGVAHNVKDDGTPVTRTDQRINELFVTQLTATFPDHSVVSEEGDRLIAGAEYEWTADPLDGSENFIFGIPINAVAIALSRYGVPQLAVVYDPHTDRLYSGQRGKGALLNGRPLHVNEIELGDTGSVVGISGKRSQVVDAPHMHAAIERAVHRVRILGSVVLEGMSVAAGQFSAQVHAGSKPYDVIASSLMVAEAGGRVTDFHGGELVFDGREIKGIIASNGVVHDDLLKIVNQCPPPRSR